MSGFLLDTNVPSGRCMSFQPTGLGQVVPSAEPYLPALIPGTGQGAARGFL